MCIIILRNLLNTGCKILLIFNRNFSCLRTYIYLLKNLQFTEWIFWEQFLLRQSAQCTSLEVAAFQYLKEGYKK